MALLSGDERGVVIMDLSDKLVTTSGEKESQDSPLERGPMLQCVQNIQQHSWLKESISLRFPKMIYEMRHIVQDFIF